MYYIVETAKSFSQASADLASAVVRNGFGYCMYSTWEPRCAVKALPLTKSARFSCNPAQAAKVLSADMRLNMVLPCRISVFTEKGKTKIGLIKPVQMLSALSQDAGLAQVAKEVETKTILMVDESK